MREGNFEQSEESYLRRQYIYSSDIVIDIDNLLVLVMILGWVKIDNLALPDL